MRFKKAILTLLLILVISFIPIATGATTREFYIPQVQVDATINNDGSIDVIERITYDFNGDFNGIVRTFNTMRDQNFFLKDVRVIDKNSNEIKATEGYDALENTYELNGAIDTEIKLYTKSSNEKKIIEIQYLLKDVMSKTDTEGRLNWNFYTVENISKVDKATLRVKVKDEALNDTNSKYQVYGDGDITRSYDDGSILINIEDLTSILAVDLIIPSHYIKDAPISNYIDESSDEYEENIYITPESNDASGIFIVAVIAGIIGMILFLAFKFDREAKKAIQEYRNTEVYTHDDFYHSQPKDISPAFVHLINNNGKASKKMLFVTLFYLAHKGYYKIEEIQVYRKKKQKSDLKFTRNKEILLPREEHLKFIIKMFKKYEKKLSFTMMGLEETFKRSSNVREFGMDIDSWVALIEKDAYDLGILTTIKNRTILTNYYNNEREKWFLYKEYLEKLIESEISEDVLNTSTILLIYATALNINSKSLKNFNSKLLDIKKYENYNDNQDNIMYNNNYFMYYPLYNTLYDNVENKFVPDTSSDFITGGDFGSSSTGSDFSGGGGGGSDAF